MVFVLVMVFCAFGCSRGDKEGKVKASAPGKKEGQFVVRVGHKGITAEEVRKQLLSGHAKRIGKVSKRAARARLKDMITSEALYQEAIDLGMDKDPEVVHKMRQIIIHKLLEEKVTKPVENWTITDNELRRYYEAHKSLYYRPEQVRVADILISVPKDAGQEQVEEKRRLAEDVLKKAVERKNTRLVFSKLIRKYSDSPRKYSRGDTGFFDRKGKPLGIDKALVEAAFNLKRHGEIAEKVIEAEDGFHVIMLVGRRPEIKRELMELAPMLKRRMKREELKKRRKAFIKEVREKRNIEINEEMFAQLISELSGGQDLARKAGTGPPPLPGQNKGK